MSATLAIRVLILEDRADDADLTVAALSEAGFEPAWRRVETETDFVTELQASPDLILADYSLPRFSALRALQALQGLGLNIPFIVVSGTIDQEMAVESLKLGATDYVVKENLERLGPVAKRALREAEEQRQRQQVEQALRASEGRFRALIELGSDVVAIVGPEGTLRYITPSVERVLGYRPDELVGTRGVGFVEPDDLQNALATLADLPDPQAASPTIELRVRHKDASIRTVEVNVRNLLETPGVQGIAVNFRDITERKQAESALHEERNLLRTLIDHLPDYVFTKDTAGRFVVSNVAHAAAIQKTPEALIGKTASDLFPPELAVQYAADDAWVMQTGQALINVERFAVDAAGSQRIVLTTKVPLRDYAGRPSGLVGISRDITERKRIEDLLVAERNLLRTLLDNLPDAVYVKDTDSRFILDNALSRRNLGVAEQADTVGKSDFDFYPWHEAEQFYADEQQVMRSGRAIVDREEAGTDNQGRPTCHLTTTVPLRDSQGQVTGIAGISHDITERQRMARALDEERNLLRTLIDTLPDYVYIKDADCRFVNANRRTALSMGVTTPGELTGKTDIDFYPPEVAADLIANEQQVIHTGQPLINREERVLDRQTGTDVWLLTTQTPVRDDAGVVVGLVGIGRDITDRKRAENQLRQLSQAVEQSPSSIVITDTRGTIEYVNPKFTEISGYTLQEVQGKNPRLLKSGETSSEVYQHLWKTITSGGEWRGELHNRTKNGQLYWEAVSISAIRDPEGKITHFLAVKEDITARKRVEQALRQSEAAEREQQVLAEALRDSALAQTSSLEPEIVMARILRDLRQVIPHECANIMLIEGDAARVAFWQGYPPACESLFKTLRIPLDTPNITRMLHTGAPCLIADTTSDPCWRHLPQTAWIRSSVGAPIQTHGQVIGFLNLDSSEPDCFTERGTQSLQAFADQAAIALENAQLYDQLRQHAAHLEAKVLERTAELNQIKERVEAILNNSSDGIAMTSANGILQQTNPAFDDLFGFLPDEARGHLLAEVIEPRPVKTLHDAMATVAAGSRALRLELLAHRLDNTPFYADLALAPVRGSQADHGGLVCSVRDITERKRLEAELRQALAQEKELNELKSRFVTMASHEFRTPLATIMGSAGLLELGLDKMSAEHRQKHFTKIQSAVRHMAELIEDVLTLGKAEAGHLDFKPEDLLLAEFCQDLVEELGVTAGQTHRLVFSTQADGSQVWADPKLLRQVLTNLLTNAIKYSPAGSRVQLDLACQAEGAIIQVRDEGRGIPEADQNHLFEAFHRANNVGNVPGTGLGLAITKKAVELHGGTITFVSEVGVGSTFTVTLPTIPRR